MKDKHVQPLLGDPTDKPDKLDLQIIRGLKQLPDHEPPPTLFPSVMLAIQSRRQSWIKRVWLWSHAPRSITFTPVRWVPAFAALLVVIILAVAFLSDQKSPEHPVSQQNLFPIVFSLTGPKPDPFLSLGPSINGTPRDMRCSGTEKRKHGL